MLWRRATRHQPLRPAQPVPAGESVRLAALQAAWRRDHRVARRRLWWRWTLWGAQRYGAPAAGAVGLLVGLGFAVHAVMGWVATPSPAEPNVAMAKPAAVPTPPKAQAAAPVPLSRPTVILSNTSGMLMKFEPALRASTRTDSPVSSPATPEAAESPDPQLISENWLHSKEP